MKKINMALNRTTMELGFMLNPTEFTKMLRGGIPLTGLFVNTINMVKNGVDETGDLLGLWSDANDKTPPLYYLSKMVPGVHQLRRAISEEVR